MAQRVELKQATASAGGTVGITSEVDLSFNPGTVLRIEVKIPPGHGGTTGLQIAQAHQVIIPYSNDDFIIGDDDDLGWSVTDFLNSGSWSAYVYNSDPTWPHTWYFRFLVNEIAAVPSLAAPVPLSTAAILTARPSAG